MLGSRFSRPRLIGGIALAALAPSLLYADAELTASATATAMRQEARLKDRTAQSMILLEEARQAYRAQKYSRAVDLYKQALDMLPRAQATADRREFISLCLSDALIATAIDYKNVGRTDEAREMLREAVSLAPASERARQELAHIDDALRNNPALTPQHAGRVEEVNRLLTLANSYTDLGLYDKAIDTFQNVLRYDANNQAAQQGIERATKRREHYFRTAHDAARAKALADVSKEWDMNVPSGAPTVAPAATKADSPLPDADENDARSALNDIVLPRVIFQDATVFEILESLQSQIRRFEQNNGSKPLNLTYNFGDPTAQVYKDLQERRVTIDLTDILLKALFDIIGAQTGTTYYMSEAGIEFTLSGKDYGPMIDETFKVPSSFFTDSGEDETNEEDAFATSSSSLKVHRVDPVKALRGMGITFPKGATAKYLPGSSTLRVHNTAANLDEIRDLVNTPTMSERVVLLNVTMIEVGENDLKELGFEWLLDISLGSHTYATGGQEQDPDNPVLPGFVSPSGAAVNTASTTTRAPSLSAGLRSGTQVIANNSIDKLIRAGTPAGFTQTGAQPAPAILAVRGVWSVADVTMIMRGLDQKKSADVLENPRILFSPGSDQQITFANIREMYYPEDYDPPELSNNNTTTPIATPAHPSSFVRANLANEGGVGTTLLVHDAEIGEGGANVTLSLTTLHNSFDGFINYGNPIMMPTLDQQGNVDTMMLTENKIVKPIFTRKCLNTKITAAPGSVIVMGGLLNSKRVRYQDKIPVLGDLPLVGRLFRSEGDENQRTALIIFAKVDLVDPAGHDINTGERPSSATDTPAP